MLQCLSTMLWLYPYKDTSVCACFINGCFMATSVTHMVTKPIKPWLTSTEKVAHKFNCFELKFKTLWYFTVRLWWCQMKFCSAKWNVVYREALCCPCAWKLLCVHKSNEILKYNHMFMCHANITLVKDVIEVGLGCAVADQIQLASWWRSWKRSTLTAS